MVTKYGGPWWKNLGCSLFCFACAAWLYWDLTQFEIAGGTVSLPRILALLYKLGGKWPPVILFLIAGLCAASLAVSELKERIFGIETPPNDEEELSATPSQSPGEQPNNNTIV